MAHRAPRWLPRLNREFARHLVFDAMILVGGAVLAYIVVDYRHRVAQDALSLDATRSAVRLMQANVDLHTAIERGSLESIAFPPEIETIWFDEEVPRNHLLSGNRPWVEIAAADEIGLRHPRDPTVEGGQHAMFWYNPALGVVRARVPRTLADSDALTLYNEVNGSRLRELTVFAGSDERE